MSNILRAFRSGGCKVTSECCHRMRLIGLDTVHQQQWPNFGQGNFSMRLQFAEQSTSTKSGILPPPAKKQIQSEKHHKVKELEKLVGLLENQCKKMEGNSSVSRPSSKNVPTKKPPSQVDASTKSSSIKKKGQYENVMHNPSPSSTWSDLCTSDFSHCKNTQVDESFLSSSMQWIPTHSEKSEDVKLFEVYNVSGDGTPTVTEIMESGKICFPSDLSEESRFLHSFSSGVDLNCLEPEIVKDVLKEETGVEEDEEETVTVVQEKAKKAKKKVSKEISGVPSSVKKKISMIKELEKVAKAVQFNWNLKSYVSVCINANMIMRAHSCLQHYRLKSRYSKKVPQVSDIQIYETVMHGWAKKGNLIRIRELFETLRDEKLKPSMQSFAAYLECLGRQQELSTWDINNILKMMQKEGYSLDRLLKECLFVSDQLEMVLKSIHNVIPDFKPQPPEYPKDYNCRLLNQLNHSTKHVNHSPCDDVASIQQLKSLKEQQVKWETRGHVTVKSVAKVAVDERVKFLRKKVNECESTWRDLLLKSFTRTVAMMKNRLRNDNEICIYPYLSVLEPHHYIDALMQEVRELAQSSETYSLSITVLYAKLGNKIMSRYFTWDKVQNGVSDKIVTLYDKYLEYFVDPKQFPLHTPREMWQKLKYENSSGPSIDKPKELWPGEVLLKVGKILYTLLQQNVKIDVKILQPHSNQQELMPAFYNVCRNSGKTSKIEIKPHPVLAKLYRSACIEDITVDVNIVPMLVPPLPWSSVQSGGFILWEGGQFIRFVPSSFQQRRLMEETKVQQLYPSFDSLNVLSMVPWKINEPLLDVIISVFQDKGWEDLSIPVPPSEFPQAPPLVPGESQKQKYEVMRERMAWNRKRAESYSLWCDALYKLSIANHFRNKIFWFPHNLDFRGRAYPCPPHFSHIGGDMARSILVFAQGKPLGEKGLEWLKLHLINLTGLKKRDPVDERLKFAEEMMPEILDSADNPLTGNKWWAQADDPWQTLACCMEIANAVRSPDPAKFISHFPVHQDGSCNGLQHYAALGRDQEGAEQVNLHPFSTPQDVYSSVAMMVEEERAKDAARGVEIAQVLNGFVKRKVVKRPVMTVVYGVTRFGAHFQVLKELEDMADFPQDKCWPASRYLVDKIFFSLRKMFTATKHIQDWFTDCAKIISKIRGQPVQWETPLGFPVIQPYYATSPRLGSLVEKHRPSPQILPYTDVLVRTNSVKQKNAFPPNFIHSLDSSHMMMTSLFCAREGITFVSVHDCFWTHPCTVLTMNRICREQFVALHSEPILEDLSKFLLKKFGFPQSECLGEQNETVAKKLVNTTLSAVPKTGSFELKNVLKSTYFFS